MREICSNKHHKVFVLHMQLYYLKLSSDYLHKSSMDKSFSRQKKILTLLKSSRSSHRDLSISELLFCSALFSELQHTGLHNTAEGSWALCQLCGHSISEH